MLLEPHPWADDGRCLTADPEIFYPERGQPTAPAKQICAACPVTTECLDYALDTGERFGIWGGKSERERRLLKWIRSGRRCKESHDTSHLILDDAGQVRCLQCRRDRNRTPHATWTADQQRALA